MIKLKEIIEPKELIPRFSVGERIIVVYTEHGGVEKSYPIVEVRKFPYAGAILYIYETAPGHHYVADEKYISADGKISHSRTGWTSS